MAARNSGMPEEGVYLVKPASSDPIAAALMCSGVSKSGSPAPKPMTSWPSAFMALALLSIERVRDGVSSCTREEGSIKGLSDFWVKDNQSTPGREMPARNASILIKTFNEGFEIVLAYLDDAHFAAGVVGRIGGVGGVDHDGRAELAADRSGRRLGRVGRPEDLADF